MPRRPKHNSYREGRVFVCESQCPTCIFRRGNKMRLAHGRVKQMVVDAIKGDSAIICHDTLSGDNAVCRGFFDRFKTFPLQIAERLGMINYV
jgi:hypothetical protein